jgi:hypothetical protein
MNTQHEPLLTTVSSAIVTNYGAYISLWYYARAVDVAGTGKATFSLSDVATTVQRSERTVERYLNKCVDRGLFTYVLRNDNLVTVYYASQYKVAASRGLENLGTTFLFNCTNYKALYRVAVLAVAGHKQQASKTKSKGSLPKPQRKFHKTVNTQKIHDKVVNGFVKPIAPSSISNGVNATGFALNGRYVLLNTDLPGVIQSGVSYKGIAESVARHASSVGRNIRKYSKGNYLRTAYTSKQVRFEYDAAVGGYGDYVPSQFVVVNDVPYLKYTNHYLVDDGSLFTYVKCKSQKSNYKRYLATLA